jgi:hypothetical protein
LANLRLAWASAESPAIWGGGGYASVGEAQMTLS